MFVVTPLQLPFAFMLWMRGLRCLLDIRDPDLRKVSDSGLYILSACIHGGNLVIVPSPG